MQRAAGTLRELAAAHPELRPDLALALFNQGGLLEMLGRPAEALPVAEEAVGLYWSRPPTAPNYTGPTARRRSAIWPTV